MKKTIRKLLSTMLIVAMVVSSMANGTTKQAQAAVNQVKSTSNYLNSSVKYLYLGEQGTKTYNFNIKKEEQKEGATYSWYIKTDKGNPDSITINKKTGIVTAKEAGTAYIRCRITLADGTIIRPEARVTVRNNITKVEINNLPMSSTITPGVKYDFNRTVLDTDAGRKAKTQGITRWEVKENTAGVKAATSKGVVLPSKQGKFTIRAVCFQSTAKYKLWLEDKEANKSYITAESEWVTIYVAPANEIATASTQEQLDELLREDSITQITLSTEEALVFTIPGGDYTKKTLIVNAANADVKNYGIFKEITINAIKDSTWIEFSNGNIFYLQDDATGFIVDKDVTVKRIVIDKANSHLNIDVLGVVNEIIVLQPSTINITGSGSLIPVMVEETAGGSEITSWVPLKLELNANTEITLNQGAEETTINKSEGLVVVKIENKTKSNITITTNQSGGETIGAGKTVISGTPIITNPTTPQGTPPSNNTYYTVTYDSNGGVAIDAIRLAGGTSLTSLPTPQKNNSIFLGWYTDSSYQNKFTEDSTVNSNLTLYAKYSEIEIEQQNLNDSYTLMEQNPGLAFTIISTDTSMTSNGVIGALALNVADGSETVELTANGSNGTFLVTAQEGFMEGASYTLTLSDSKLSFKDKENSIRKCSFTIAKTEVYHIELNDDIVYLPNSSVVNMTKDGSSVESLSLAVVDLTGSGSSDETTRGTFTYTGNTALNSGDILCIYSGDKPEAPTGNENDASFLDDDIAYVKIVTVTGSTGSQMVSYSNVEADEVIYLPDVLPISLGDYDQLTNYTAATVNTSGSFTEETSDLNFGAYSEMDLTEETTIDVGDYLAFYTGNFDDESIADSVVYGRVTDVTYNNGSVTVAFTATTEEEMLESLDYYSKNDIEGGALLDDINIAAVEEEMEQQVLASGFAEEASVYLTALALETDGFKKIAGDDFILESYSAKMADGSSANLDEISLMAVPSKISIKNLIVKANIGTNLQKLSGKGVRCAVAVSFDVPIKTKDGDTITLSLSATFVEELKISVNASGKVVWIKRRWRLPKIGDYQMNANIDVYNFTGISFQAMVTSKEGGTIDISKEIQKILSYTDSEQISAGVQELFEIYSDMMDNDVDWIEIFKQNISTSNAGVLLGIIQIRTTVDFVVSGEINMALGCNFEYKSGTRYCFWAKLKAKDAGSDTIDLMDEVYSFQFYVMGSLGLRAGIKLEFAVGLLSVDLNSVGLTAEAGVYTRLYGYFYYNLESVNNLKTSSMSGALLLDFGIYLDIAFKAQVLNGKYQYNPTLFEKEWPLMSAGTRYNVYDFSYAKSSEAIKLKDTVRTYTLPDNTFSMTYLDLREGGISTKAYKASDFNITFSNRNFSLVGNTVKVNVPTGNRKLECDMTVTWKSSSLAFSSLPLTRSFHLVWDDLNDNGYTISYNSLGGSAASSVTQLYGTTVTEPTAPKKAGYTFNGWYSDENLTAQYTFSTMPAENIVLYAKWTANNDTSYQVEHYQQNLVNDDYTLHVSETLSGTTGTTATATANTYTGFIYRSNTIGTASSGIIAGEGSLVLKMYYDRNGYILNFKPQNGGNDIVKTLKYGATISAPTVVKTGYSFHGWDKAVDITMPATNTTYTAQWTPNNYSIEFISNDGSNVDKITQSYGTIVNAPTIPTKSGHNFSGWYRDSSLTQAYTFSTMPAESVTLYAKWDLITNLKYSVEHYKENVSGGGYTVKNTENLTGTFDTTVTATSKTYDGFTFDNGHIGTVNSGKLIADGSLVLKQYYDRNTYVISFVSNGGSTVNNISQKYGTTVTKPLDPTRTSFTFVGWYMDSNLSVPYTFGTMPAQNSTCYAKWNTEGIEASYQLWVGGIQVTTNNMNSITGEGITGTVSYDPSTNTLTLNNASITGDYNYINWGMYAICDLQESKSLTINVIGENTIQNASVSNTRMFGIGKIKNDLIINGDSSARLTVNASKATYISAGISIEGILTVTGGAIVIAKGGTSTGIIIRDNLISGFSLGIYDWAEDLTVHVSVTNNSVLKLYGDSAITSQGYLKNNGGGSLSISNGGQIVAAGNTKAMDGSLSGSSQVKTGQLLDGSDETNYTGSTTSGWSTNFKYASAISLQQ